MLSPVELLNLAQSMAARIPRTAEYSEERNAAWLAVGVARLKFDDIADAQRGLESIDDVRVQARLRVAADKWAGEHPESEMGRKMLQDTATQFSTFEAWLTRKDVDGLVPAVFKVLGIEGVHSIARQLEDLFTAGNVYVTLSCQLSDVAMRREELLHAEKLATSVREGDRDWALRWVFRGYQYAGLTDDAERVRRLASLDPGELTRNESAALADSEKYLPQIPGDTQLARLRRYLDYKSNDLKVAFLIDASLAGNINDPEIEELIRNEPFQRLEAARAPRLSADTSTFDAVGMARFLFGRPVCQHPADRLLLAGEDYCDSDPEAPVFVRQMTSLFRDFGKLAATFSMEQVEQGLWFVFGHPFWLRDMIGDPRVLSQSREECLRSMVHPFRDYLLPREDTFTGSAFHMWWDSLLYYKGDEIHAQIEAISLDVIRQILRLPGKQSQFAALHGLNHLHSNTDAAATVVGYLEEHRASLTADEIVWVEACAAGAAM
jgi:hypothetical protein